MSDDAVRWDDKYRTRQHPDIPQPDPLLVEHLEIFQPGQRVVDLASGRGRHSLPLARRGCFVIPVDVSQVALDICYSTAESNDLVVHPIVADLQSYRFPPDCLDALICFNYLNRALADNICSALKPGGHFVMKTFNENFLLKNTRFNPNYVLAPGELTAMFDELEALWLNDDCSDRSVTKSSIVARRN